MTAAPSHPCPSGDPAAPYRGIRLTPEQIREVLALHRAWRLNGKGRRADLRGADLRGADLSYAVLSDANLSDANLSDADLSGAVLSDANLRSAYLSDANLSDADLSGAYLSDANLSDANLSDADLSGAYLSSAYLSSAYLGRTLQRVGPIDGWTMVAVQWDDGPRIACGCLWFAVADARTHWGAYLGGERDAHGKIMLAGLDALLSICRAHGWTGCDR